MGGTNAVASKGLRMHLSGGETHIHDDAAGLKFSLDAAMFKSDIEGILKSLSKVHGITEIPGNTKTSLYIVRDAMGVKLFLSDQKDQEKDLQKFLKGC